MNLSDMKIEKALKLVFKKNPKIKRLIEKGINKDPVCRDVLKNIEITGNENGKGTSV